MIKNIIFDFGDVFINLDKTIIFRAMERFGGSIAISPKLQEINNQYEVGKISSDDFVSNLKEIYPQATKEEITTIWNGMILDFPETRLKYIEALAKDNKYRLFLLSNTNELHISKVKETMGLERYELFKKCFEQFYLSHEIQLRKPNAPIFEFVLKTNRLKAEETLFIDDTLENTKAAEKLHINVWHLKVGTEDILELKSKL